MGRSYNDLPENVSSKNYLHSLDIGIDDRLENTV